MQRKIRIGSFFSGVEGGTLALPKGKFELVCVSEVDKNCNELLAKHYSDVPNLGDISKINTDQIPDFDLMLFGASCQSYSCAGARKGLDDPRGAIIEHVYRILKDKQPEYFLMENVVGLTTHNKGETIIKILTDLSNCGYVLDFEILRSSDFGVRQNRDRVYIFGIHKDKTNEQRKTIQNSTKKFNRLSEEEDTGESSRDKFSTIANTGDRYAMYSNFKQNFRDWITSRRLPYKDTINNANAKRRDSDDKNSQVMISWSKSHRSAKTRKSRPDKRWIDARMRINDNANTLLTGDGCRAQSSATVIYNPRTKKCRKITPTEAERLQSWPGDHTEGFPDSIRYSMVGNGISSLVIKDILSILVNFNG